MSRIDELKIQLCKIENELADLRTELELLKGIVKADTDDNLDKQKKVQEKIKDFEMMEARIQTDLDNEK